MPRFKYFASYGSLLNFKILPRYKKFMCYFGDVNLFFAYEIINEEYIYNLYMILILIAKFF